MRSIDCEYPNPYPSPLWTFPPTGNAEAAPVSGGIQSWLIKDVYKVRKCLIEHVNEADREPFSGSNYSDIVEYWVHL